METSRKLVLTFAQGEDDQDNLTLYDYKEDLTDEEIQTGGDAILSADIFAPNGKAYTAFKEAHRIVTTDTTVLLED